MSGRGPREPVRDALVPEGAADSGFHAGLHLGPGDLEPDEERLLAALERDSAALHVDPIEDFVAGVRAARADTSPATPLAVPDDGLTPLFTEPDEP